MTAKVVAHFKLEKTTPGALRFKEVAAPNDDTPMEINNGAKIGTLYLRKSSLDGDVPERITVTVTVG